jgi:peptidoglycan/LPS O-acetylase OafA/YrhL
MGSIIDGFKTWELSLSGNTYFSLGNQYKGDQGVTSFFVLSGIISIHALALRTTNTYTHSLTHSLGFLIPFTFTRLIKSKRERYLTWWTAVEYLFRRYARIAPAIYVATIIVIIIGSAYSQDSYMYYLFYTKCARTWYQNYLFVNNYSGIMSVSNCYDRCAPNSLAHSLARSLY